MSTRIVIADDHAMFRELLRDQLLYGGDYKIVGSAKDGDETLILVARDKPDLLLLDYKMPGLDRLFTFCGRVAQKSPNTRIILLTGYADEKVALESAMAGVRGYLLKGSSVANAMNAITAVSRGGIWVDPALPLPIRDAFLHRGEMHADKLCKLTRQEVKTLYLMAQGLNNGKIAGQLHISKKTVKNHITHIYAKLGVQEREAAIRYVASTDCSKDNK